MLRRKGSETPDLVLVANAIAPSLENPDHLSLAALVGRGLTGESLSAEERGQDATAFDVSDETFEETLGRHEDPDEVSANDGLIGETVAAIGPTEPEAPFVKTILCTTLQGAKGLSGEHIFIVGLMGGHLPRDNANPSDKETCEFLVALSRTRTVDGRRTDRLDTLAPSRRTMVA